MKAMDIQDSFLNYEATKIHGCVFQLSGQLGVFILIWIILAHDYEAAFLQCID